jgi:hypothetical protein
VAMDMPWAKLVGQIAHAYRKQNDATASYQAMR